MKPAEQKIRITADPNKKGAFALNVTQIRQEPHGFTYVPSFGEDVQPTQIEQAQMGRRTRSNQINYTTVSLSKDDRLRFPIYGFAVIPQVNSGATATWAWLAVVGGEAS